MIVVSSAERTRDVLEQAIRDRIAEHVTAEMRQRDRILARNAQQEYLRQIQLIGRNESIGIGRGVFPFIDIACQELAVRADLAWEAIRRACQNSADTLQGLAPEDLEREIRVHVSEQGLAVRQITNQHCRGGKPNLDEAVTQRSEELVARLKIEAQYFVDQLRRPAQDTINKILNFHAPVGAVQVGPYSTAHVSMSDPAGQQLVQALEALREALDRSAEVSVEQREHSVELVEELIGAVKAERTNPPKMQGLLSGLATIVQTLDSVRGAWQTVRDTFALIGIRLP